MGSELNIEQGYQAFRLSAVGDHMRDFRATS